MAERACTAAARRGEPRQGAVRPDAPGGPDLSARPPALCQLRVPGPLGLCQPARAGAGRRDALFVEPGVSSVSSTSDIGTPVTISASPSAGQAEMPAADAHLHTIS